MSGFLVDTNVVSELTRRKPDSRVLDFLIKHQDLWLSAIVLHELNFGISLLPPRKRRQHIGAIVTAFVTEFSDRILPVGSDEATQAARFRAQMLRSGRNLDLRDALIAGTAKANALVVATRNDRDFELLDIEVVSPWDWP